MDWFFCEDDGRDCFVNPAHVVSVKKSRVGGDCTWILETAKGETFSMVATFYAMMDMLCGPDKEDAPE